MGSRRVGRQCALQLLYQHDVSLGKATHVTDAFWAEQKASAEAKTFAEELLVGVQKNCSELDAVIEKYSANWKLSRIASVDKNVLRLAIYELLYREDIPKKVTLNEAVEIAKRFGTEESGAFVNGILDNIAKNI